MLRLLPYANIYKYSRARVKAYDANLDLRGQRAHSDAWEYKSSCVCKCVSRRSFRGQMSCESGYSCIGTCLGCYTSYGLNIIQMDTLRSLTPVVVMSPLCRASLREGY